MDIFPIHRLVASNTRDVFTSQRQKNMNVTLSILLFATLIGNTSSAQPQVYQSSWICVALSKIVNHLEVSDRSHLQEAHY